MKDLKKVKYLILDMDGCVYHPRYLKTLFGQVSAKMTEFIALKLGIDKFKAIAIVSNTGARPCGSCRQIMYEYLGDIPIYISDSIGDKYKMHDIKELLPYPFG